MMRRQAVSMRPAASAVLLLLAMALGACSGAGPKPQIVEEPAAAAPATAREVVDRFLVKIGGAERLLQREAMTVTGVFAIPAQGLEGTLTMWSQAPDRLRMEIEIPGLGKIHSGYDGEAAWSIDPIMGAQVLTAESAAQMREQANFHSLLYRPEDYPTLTLEGVTDFQGTECFELTVVSKAGLQSQQYFAVDSGLLVGMAQTQYSPMGEIPSVSALKEYREFEGVLMATVTEQSMMGMQQIINLQTVSFAPIEPEFFAVPAEIAALLETQE